MGGGEGRKVGEGVETSLTSTPGVHTPLCL